MKKRNVFLFHLKSSFHSRENQISEFWMFRFHDVIKCLRIKQEIHLTEIWPVYVILQKKNIHKKILQKLQPEN